MDEDNDTRQDDAARTLEMLAKLLSLAYALVSLLWLLWILIPDHQKRLIAMRMVRNLHLTARRAAFRAGHQAMARELSGHATSYELPYRLSLAAEQTARLYDKLRYTA